MKLGAGARGARRGSPPSPLGDGAGVPHPQPADRPPRHGAEACEAGRPEGLGLPPAPGRPPACPQFTSAASGPTSPRPAAAASPPAPWPPSCGTAHRFCRHFLPASAPRPPASARGARPRASGARSGSSGWRLERRPSGGRRRRATRAAAGTEPGLWSRRCRAEEAGAAQPAAMAGYARRSGRHPRCPGPGARHSGR